MPTSNIDDLLMGVGNSQQPATPEHKDNQVSEENPEIEVEYESDFREEDDDNVSRETSEGETQENDDDDHETQNVSRETSEEDEYGNPKEELSKGMQKRLERQAESLRRKHEDEINALRQQLQNQGANAQVQQAAKDFEYNPNEEGSWQQQLSEFVKQTITSMEQEKTQRQRQQEEQHSHQEFEKKFRTGMDKFEDFREIVGSQPIDDAMTLALRGMNDPAAFIYAASKRNPQELERISKLRDPYARMVEMGKLEERMRKVKQSTNAPRPLGRATEDSTRQAPAKKKEMTGDDLLASADSKRLAQTRSRLKNNR